MTNREKFREVYGFDTDCGKCNPYPCKEDDCEWWEQCKDHPGCPCENWWDIEYKAPAAKNDLGVDCINRANAIKAMQNKAKELKNEDIINGLCGAVAILYEMPSVTPKIEPKTGHWIKSEIKNATHCVCSECGEYWDITGDLFAFCPCCGAKMEDKLCGAESEDT